MATLLTTLTLTMAYSYVIDDHQNGRRGKGGDHLHLEISLHVAELTCCSCTTVRSAPLNGTFVRSSEVTLCSSDLKAQYHIPFILQSVE